ncbi:MAG: DUF4065 domain-containing protein [Candidatus Bilamarchaeaceae archaeon]
MSEYDSKSIGKRIKTLRVRSGITQKHLGDILNVSRSEVSLIENGKVRLTIDEIQKIAKALNCSLEYLLGLKKGYEINIEEKNGCEKEETEKIRINVPQKNLHKFKQVLLYILNKVGAKPNIGETVIYKLLYFIDFNYYEKYEEQLIGATYIKNHYGPTPLEFQEIVEDMVKNKEIIVVKSKYYEYPQKKYLPLKEPDLSVLSGREIKEIDEVLEKFSDWNAADISKYSYHDIPWLVADDNGPIEYEAVFYRTKPYSVRKYEEDIE